MKADQITVDLLPIILQSIVGLIGMPATLAIVEARGGIGLYIPSGVLADDHYLVKLIGREAAEKLQSEYPGEELEIPLARKAARAVRNAELRRDRKVMSVPEVARKYGTCERNVRLICGEMVDDRQESLF